MKQSLILLFILCITSLTRAQQPDQRFAPVAPYVDGQTLLVAHADIQRLDLAGDDNKFLTVLRTAYLRDLEAEEAAKEARDSVAAARRWREEFVKFGGQHIYAVHSLIDIVREPPYLIVTHRKGGNLAPLRALLLSGRADGAENAPRSWPQRAESVNDTTIIVGSKEQVERARAMKPIPRPELATAVAALPPDAPFALLVVPSPDVRKAAEWLLPAFPRAFGADAARTLTRGVVFASLGTDLSPKTAITLTIQSEDPAAANGMADFLKAGLADLARNLPEKPAAAAIPQFQVKGDRVVTTMDDVTTQAFLTHTIAPGLKTERVRAERVKSATNMRQILEGLVIHANAHKGVWPDELRDLIKSVNLPQTSLQQPYRSAKGGYVYLKPPFLATQLDRPDRIILYEENPVPPFINVGFADGHVELIQQSAFDKRLKEQKKPVQAQPK